MHTHVARLRTGVHCIYPRRACDARSRHGGQYPCKSHRSAHSGAINFYRQWREWKIIIGVGMFVFWARKDRRAGPMLALAPDDIARNVWYVLYCYIARVTAIVRYQAFSHYSLSLSFSLLLDPDSNTFSGCTLPYQTCPAVNLSPIPSAAYVCQVNVPDHYERMDTDLE